jgi:ABC-2 type transport system ATP-binding protein
VLHEPKLLVLDEPTNGLDPRQIIELRGLVRGLAEHCAVLITSHVLAEIERIADRAAILLDGRLLAIHTIERSVVDIAAQSSPLESVFLELTAAKALQ